jgi:hypothetical protein
MPTTIVIETVAEWAARHGGDPVRIKELIYYPDGAVLASPDGFERRIEPLPNEHANLTKRVRRYWEERVRRAEADFWKLKNAMLGNTYPVNVSELYHAREFVTGYGPDDGGRVLERLKEIASEHRAKLADVDRRIAASPEFRERARLRDLEERAAALALARDDEMRFAALSVTLEGPAAPARTDAADAASVGRTAFSVDTRP